MEENSFTSKKNNALKVLPFLEVGVFEVAFVGVVLFLLFGTLNYFNILSISNVFPHQLGWLPHKTSQNKTPSKPNSQLTPDPVLNYSSNVFQYDAKKAETLLTQYLKDNIKPEFLPAKIDIKQGLSIDNRIEDIKYQFGVYLLNNKETISANFHYKENTNDPNDFSIFIEPKTVSGTTATVSLANSLLTSYFTNPFSISSCQTKSTTSYCENFQTLDEGKKGYGTVFLYQGAKLTPLVFNCIVPKGNKDYDSRNSCITP